MIYFLKVVCCDYKYSNVEIFYCKLIADYRFKTHTNRKTIKN